MDRHLVVVSRNRAQSQVELTHGNIERVVAAIGHGCPRLRPIFEAAESVRSEPLPVLAFPPFGRSSGSRLRPSPDTPVGDFSYL